MSTFSGEGQKYAYQARLEDATAHTLRHSFNEAKAKGLARLTNRDYVVQPGEIIEIRFNIAP
jgi:ribosome-binding ATPase YchF (GTP1/OBG family)